ncbi:MAG: HyaD/HybD family hydrogenase maturation endopeptidase [Deltaproteobacteria bacterium]|nr:HyaD/HybD family hydrogenase maturation endopeptidase [Deltaproteobacteria bacterium]
MSERNFVTVLGIGNILMGDEGFGIHFTRWLSRRYRPNDDIRIIDGGTLGYALLDIICSCDHLIIVDVLKVDDAPGSIYRFNKEEMELHLPPPTTAHEVTFPDVLFKSELMGEAPETIFLCIVPQDYKDLRMEMTPLLYDKFGEMEKFLLRELEKLNIKLESLPDA